jgi:endogenous inhibitor of DNA gyrase (YacG/DUF329 family)
MSLIPENARQAARQVNVDLGAWASEDFRLPDQGAAEDQLTDPGSLQ